MFEAGLSELLMVGVVALVVIGPEKLPAVARLAGFWLGKSRRIFLARPSRGAVWRPGYMSKKHMQF